MDTARPTAHALATARRLPRPLLALPLALALVALPAAAPPEASARRMSERQAMRTCARGGGDWHIDFSIQAYGDYFESTCTLPSDAKFTCVGEAGENSVDCGR